MDEFEIIKKYLQKLTKNNPGALKLNDDVFFHKKKEIVLSIDTYNEGVHYINFKHPDLVMKKIIRSSISDLFCKGVNPKYIFLSVSGNKKHFNRKNIKLISKSISEGRQNKQYQIERIVSIPSFPLSKILDTHLPLDQKINFLSVDVEGLDLTVLASNDWEKYRPKVVLVEVLDTSLNKLEKDPIYSYMVTQGYTLFAKLVHTCIFKIEE